MKRALLLVTLAACSCSSAEANGRTGNNQCPGDEVEFVENAPVAVWLTMPDQSKLLSREVGLSFAPNEDLSVDVLTMELFPQRTYQTMDGFGAAFTDSAAWLIWNRLDEGQRNELMRELFDPVEGAGFSFMRHVAGASDFALSNYTYDDLPPGESDPGLENFSIDHDREYIIPVMKQALEINPALKFMGTSWSPPAWMKTSESLIGGRLKPEHFDTYARYLLRYTQAFEAEGLPIYMITPQNEPEFAPEGYPGMLMPLEDQHELVVNHIGPLFQAESDTLLISHDHNWDLNETPLGLLAFPRAFEYLTGTAFHCYGGEVAAQLLVKEAFPGEEIWLTECTGLVGSPFGADLEWQTRNLIIASLRFWSKSALMWNLALDQDSGPKNGGCQNCRGVVTINQESGEVEYNVEYYVLGHGAKAAIPGAVRIASSSFVNLAEGVAFRNPDGTWGLVVLNPGDEGREFKVLWGDQGFIYTLPAGAVATFRWPME